MCNIVTADAVVPNHLHTFSRAQIIYSYFKLGYKYKEIIAALFSVYGIKISLRQLKRLLKRMQLRRRGIPEDPLDQIISAMLKEISGSGKCLGYKALWHRLKLLNMHVKRSTVWRLMHIINPDGIERRRAKRLMRRQYSAPGPNHTCGILMAMTNSNRFICNTWSNGQIQSSYTVA